MSTANTAPIIDTSNSMTFNGYADLTVRSSKAFVSYARPGDKLAVVNYDAAGHVTFPLSTVDQNLNTNAQAANAIQGLTFTGPSTAIGSGILAARGFMDGAAAPKGLVLLSDGYQKAGPPPLDNLPSYPIYSCAMGATADIALMKDIAVKTGGIYYNAPYPSTMMFIYNEIRGLPAFVQSVQNVQEQIPAAGYKLIPVTISGANSEGQFGVVWDDSKLTYTDSPNPSPEEISITLVSPSQPVTPAPAIVGPGYAVFNLPNPESGQWYTQVISGSPTNTTVTSGAFEFPTDPTDTQELDVTVPVSHQAGRPLEFHARVTDRDQTVKGLQLQAVITQPTISVGNALQTFETELSDITLTDEDMAGGAPEHVARLRVLANKLRPERDILAHRSYPLLLTEAPDGTHHGRLESTREAGSYSIHVTVAGHSPISNQPFERSKLVTAVVDDSQ